MAGRITAVAVLLLSLPTLARAADPSGVRDLRDVRGTAGFWRVARDDAGAWWFISPNGRREFLNSVTTVQPHLAGRDRNGTDYLSKDFDGASLNHWAEATVRRVADCGFKGIGAWSEPVLHQYDLPMTRDLNVCTWFGGDVRQLSRPEFESQLEQVIREQVAPLKDNRNLVGYYLDNELNWGGDTAETYAVARRYFEVTTRLVRKHDPNHLILGVRFRGAAPRQVVRASAGLTDAQSINYYPGDARLDRELFESLHQLSGGQPVIVSEYSFHALDGRSGNRNRFGFPAQVRDQKARAEGYRQMTTRLARLPYVIGADWFQWMDEPASGRIRDGEDVNFGVVDVKDEPYGLLVDAVRSTTPLLNPLHGRSTRDSYADVWRGAGEAVAGVGTDEKAGGTPAPQLNKPKKESPAVVHGGASQCALLVVGGDPRVLPYYRAAWQPRVTAGIAPCGSCLQQPTRTVTIGHGSPPFRRTTGRTKGRRSWPCPTDAGGFEGDCRLGIGRRLASPLGSRP